MLYNITYKFSVKNKMTTLFHQRVSKIIFPIWNMAIIQVKKNCPIRFQTPYGTALYFYLNFSGNCLTIPSVRKSLI